MACCLVTNRPFPDGPVREPVLESDPVNMAWALSGHYLSFLTARRLSDVALRRWLAPFDPVIVALDRQDLTTCWRVVQAAPARVFTYSEGHIQDYQSLRPADQERWVEVLRHAHLNLIYWERYVPFYQSLSPVPVAYLPYPYLVEFAASKAVRLENRPLLGVVPTGLAGGSRNGLADLLVVQHLREEGALQDWVFCLDADKFDEDARSILSLLGAKASGDLRPPSLPRWKRWLIRSGLDYRPLLRLRQGVRRWVGQPQVPPPTLYQAHPDLAFLRRTGWERYLDHLARARFMVDLNDRETVGRNALDGAALGVPCVSTPCSDLQPRLFPETTVRHPWAVDEAVALCRRLLADGDFYARVCDQAWERLQEYGPEAFRRRFECASRASPPAGSEPAGR
ncbi:MAG: hypothetical protein ACUVXG_09885 [Anaerolineae bacterium]